MWYYKEETGNFSVGFIPTTTVHHVNPDGTEYDIQGAQEDGWVLIADRPLPHDDYIFDGVNWVAKVVPIVVPQVITPRQARLALLQATLLDEVELLLVNDRAMQIWWEYSLEILRNHPHIITMGTALGLTSEQLDGLFTNGALL